MAKKVSLGTALNAVVLSDSRMDCLKRRSRLNRWQVNNNYRHKAGGIGEEPQSTFAP
jgi:hypothetical protein